MNPHPSVDLKDAPKQFCDNISIGYSDEFFAVALFSGGMVDVYAITPEHAKRLSQSLAFNVGEYEKRFGEIKAEWSEGVRSPIQMSDPKKK
jgi:hypothetical protein